MENFVKKLNKWNKNGSNEFVQQRYKHKSEKEMAIICQNYAKMAYNLGLNDLFANKIDNIRFSDGYYYLKQLMPENVSVGQTELLDQFSKDFMKRFLDDNKTEQERKTLLNTFIKMSEYFTHKIINSQNYTSASQILLNTYASLEENIPNFETEIQSNMIQKIFSPKISNGLEGSFNFKKKSDYFKRLKIISEGAKTFKDFEKLNLLAEGMDCYLRRDMRIDDTFFKGMIGNVIPDIKKGKENTSEDNLWGMYFFDYGIADLKYKALTTIITPSSLSGLLQAYRETPSADFRAFEQNRIDGLSLQSLNPDFRKEKGLDQLRDGIHDQRPLTAELIGSMVEYYDAVKNGINIKEKMDMMLYLNRKNISFEIDEKYLSNIVYYEQKAETYGKKGEFEPVIDILRRLDKNMNQKEMPSKVNNGQIDQLMNEYSENAYQIPWLEKILAETNSYLLKRIDKKEIGIDPKMLGVITWLDNKTANVINGLDYEYQLSAFKEEWFKNAVKFSLLISNSGESFSEAEFEQFYNINQINTDPEDMYEIINQKQIENLEHSQKEYLRQGISHLMRIDPEMPQEEAARILSKKASDLGKVEVINKFNRIANGNKEEKLDSVERRQLFIIFQYQNRLDRMGSGNTLKALQNMIYPHEASTIVGQHYRSERIKEQPKIRNLYQAICRSNIDISHKDHCR